MRACVRPEVHRAEWNELLVAVEIGFSYLSGGSKVENPVDSIAGTLFYYRFSFCSPLESGFQLELHLFVQSSSSSSRRRHELD